MKVVDPPKRAEGVAYIEEFVHAIAKTRRLTHYIKVNEKQDPDLKNILGVIAKVNGNKRQREKIEKLSKVTSYNLRRRLGEL